VKTLKELAGFWTGGPYALVKAYRERSNPLTLLHDIRIPARNEIDPLASFILFTPPSGLALDLGDGYPLDDDHFYLAVLLDEKPMTFREALEKDRVYAFFPGDGGWPW